MKEQIQHSEPMANFLQIARYVLAAILTIMGTWVFFVNIFGGYDDEEFKEMIMPHYLYTFVGYGLALLVLLLTPSGFMGKGE